MRLKSFYGPTLNDAMRLVRQALGEDAIIVTTSDEEDGGFRVTAAIDEPPPAAGVPHAPKAEDDDGSSVIEKIAEALVRHQVPPSLSERLTAAAMRFADDDPEIALGAAFDAHFKFEPIDADAPGKPLMFLGPPGAGKTLTVAKFATQATLAKQPVAALSADTERAGGIEQLAAFTRLLKTGMMQVEDAASLRGAIRMQTADTLILVDTPGRNPFIESEREQLRALAAVCGEAVLVLPAGMDSSEALDMAIEFRSIGATRLLPTRLDMTRRLGSMLRTAFEARLPFANFSASHKVTEPPQPLNPVAMARMVLNRDRGSGIGDQQSTGSLGRSPIPEPRTPEKSHA